ncbi:MAG: HIT family protein [Thermoplasmata archaeon]
MPESRKYLQNECFYAAYDLYPVNRGHTLIIPHRHFPSFFEISPEEWHVLHGFICTVKSHIDKEFKPDGYNIGINAGLYAGQTIFHLHIHLIPRYKGDIEGNPRGGIRNFKKPLVDYPEV